MEVQGCLLLIEDNPAIQANNKKVLERLGYKICQAYTLAQAREIVAQQEPAAIVLDIGMPDGCGLDFLRELRRSSNIPVLIVTAMGTPEDAVRGLEAGGDDYLPKPYDHAVFLKRVEALLRRAALVPDRITVGPLVLEPASGKAHLDGEDMGLSQKEFSLLLLFVQRPGVAISAQYLYEKVWGQNMLGDDSSVKPAISRLRKKLENSGYVITAHRGTGYVFEQC